MQGHQLSGQQHWAESTIRWSASWLMACHISPTEFVAQARHTFSNLLMLIPSLCAMCDLKAHRNNPLPVIKPSTQASQQP